MKHIWCCRRTFISLIGIVCLTGLGFYTADVSVAMAISGAIAALCGANAWEKKTSISPKQEVIEK